ncbi:ABC transporter substrate-binding protein [Pseudonocardia xishanensis]|uniref:NitT/TauT family transport system substrate-binding protein n=1 Tax=Pseudonocardia xishanensis TaxID=630995 RepID=A0ABP8RUA2_9PSEU
MKTLSSAPGRRFRLLLAPVALLAFALSACAGTTSGSTTDDGVVRFMNSSKSFTALPGLYAMQSGLYADAGLKVTELPLAQNSVAPVQAMLAGQVDMVMVGGEGVLAAHDAGQTNVVTVAVIARPTYQLVLSEKAIAAVAASGVSVDAPIDRKVAALKGLTLGTNGAGTSIDAGFRATLASAGLEPDRDVTIRPIPDASASLAAFREGQIDGYTATLPNPQIGVAEGIGEVWIDYAGGEVPQLKDLTFFHLATTREFIESHHDSVQKFVDAITKADDEIKADPDEVMKTMSTTPYFKDLDPKVYQSSFEQVLPALSGGPAPTEAGFQAQLDLANANPNRKGPSKATFAEVFDTSFVTAEAAE